MSITRTVKGDKAIYQFSSGIEVSAPTEILNLSNEDQDFLNNLEVIHKNSEYDRVNSTKNENPVKPFSKSKTFNDSLDVGTEGYLMFKKEWFDKLSTDKSSEFSESVSTLDNLISQIECQLIRQAEAIEFIAIKLNTLTPYAAAVEYNPDEERELPEGKFSQLQVVLNRMKSHYNDLNKICEFLTTNI